MLGNRAIIFSIYRPYVWYRIGLLKTQTRIYQASIFLKKKLKICYLNSRFLQISVTINIIIKNTSKNHQIFILLGVDNPNLIFKKGVN